jgi:hypothetical protein
VSDDKKSGGGFFAKVFGAIFALMTAVATPLIVKYSDKIFGVADTKPTTPAPLAAAQDTHPQGRKGNVAPVHPGKEASNPRKEGGHPGKDGGHPGKEGVHAGKDNTKKEGPAPKLAVPGSLLDSPPESNFSSYVWNPDKRTRERDTGFNTTVFDFGNGTLHVLGTPVGALVTKKEFENYTLTLEYKWGDKTSPERANKNRLAMILVHASEEGEKGPWMPSVACLLSEGDGGSLRLIGEPGRYTAMGAVKLSGARGQRRDYMPGAPPQALSGPAIIHRLGFPDKHEDVKGWHPEGDPAIPGQWNTLDILCMGTQLSVLVNGKEVNALSNLSVRKGKIALTSDQAEYFVRKFQVKPLK